MSDNPYAQFAKPAENPYDQFKKPEKAKAPNDPDVHHLFNPIEDIERAASESLSALKEGWENPEGKGSLIGQAIGVRPPDLGRMSEGLAGFAASPVTGLARSGLGSAIAEVQPDDPARATYERGLARGSIAPGTPPPAAQPPRSMSDKKKTGDDLTDLAMMAVGGPELGGMKELSAEEKLIRLQNAAKERVLGMAKRDNLTAQDILNEQAKAHAVGDSALPLAMGQNLTRGAKTIYQRGGELTSDINKFLTEKWAQGSDFLKSEVQKIKGGSTFETQEALEKAQKSVSAPLFDEALSSHTIAPLEAQFNSQFERSIQERDKAYKTLSAAQAHVSALEAEIARPIPGYNPPTKNEILAARNFLKEAEEGATSAEQNKITAQKFLSQAQKEKENGVPGSVWSPKLDTYMKNDSIVRKGMQDALRIEKRNALSEGRPFVDSDYGITGWDKEENPIISKVPTMRAWAGANEHLKEMATKMVHTEPGIMFGRPTKEGRSVRKLQNALEEELYTLRPQYKAATDAWAGPAASVDAINQGRAFFRDDQTTLEQWKSEIAALSPSQKEFFKLGAAEDKVNELSRVPGKQTKVAGKLTNIGDSARVAVRHDEDAEKFRLLFDSPKEAQSFFDSVARRAEHQNATKKITSGLVGDPDDLALKEKEKISRHVSSTALGAVAHSPFHIFRGIADTAKTVRGRTSQPLQEEVMKILSNPDIKSLTQEPVRKNKPIKKATATAITTNSFNDLLDNAKNGR